MALKIRLRQQGRNNRAFYRVVVTDVRAPRDGRYVEAIGWYNPIENDPTKLFSLDTARIQHWLDQGAQMTENAQQLIGKADPALLRKQTEKQLALRAKAATKRKARKKTAAQK